MDQKARRAAIAKALKAGGAKARKGHLRLEAGDLFWYVDVRADSPSPAAALVFEVGCWLPGVLPEPEGGAIDCPFLADVPVGEDVQRGTEGLLDLISRVDDPAALRRLVEEDALPGALVDRVLRELLG